MTIPFITCAKVYVPGLILGSHAQDFCLKGVGLCQSQLTGKVVSP
jgi:hypothetical protein